MGNVRTSSIARWKRVADFLFAIIERFRYSSYGWDVISRYRSKSALFRKGWVTFSANFRWKGTSPPTIVGIRKASVFVTSQWRPHDPIFIGLDNVPACDRQMLSDVLTSCCSVLQYRELFDESTYWKLIVSQNKNWATNNAQQIEKWLEDHQPEPTESSASIINIPLFYAILGFLLLAAQNRFWILSAYLAISFNIAYRLYHSSVD